MKVNLPDSLRVEGGGDEAIDGFGSPPFHCSHREIGTDIISLECELSRI